jgi:hypothetical protein
MRSARCHQPGRDSRARASPEPVIQQTPYAKHRPADRLIDLLTACRVAAEPDTLNGRWPLTGATGVPRRGPLQSPCEQAFSGQARADVPPCRGTREQTRRDRLPVGNCDAPNQERADDRVEVFRVRGPDRGHRLFRLEPTRPGAGAQTLTNLGVNTARNPTMRSRARGRLARGSGAPCIPRTSAAA